MTIEATVGTDHFLQNKYFSLGINSGGTLGTSANAPSAFNTAASIGYVRLGMYADFDGFNVGKASTINDVMLEGTPVEGFSIGYKESGKTFVRTNHDRAGVVQVAGTGSSSMSGTTAKASWAGETGEGVEIKQVITLTGDNKFVRVDLVVTNTSNVAATDVRYMRTIDPDQGSGFVTENKIVQQAGSKGALVAAYAPGGVNPFFLYANDARAVVSTYGFDNRDPYAAAAYTNPQATGYSLKADAAVNLTFSFGTLAAGASTTATFYMGVTDELAATIGSIGSVPPTNTPPIAADDSFSLVAGTVLNGNVLSNDTDPQGTALTALVKTGPVNGSLSFAANGTFTYTPKAGFTGSDSFTYAASDGSLSDLAVVRITVKPTVPVDPTPAWHDDPLLLTAGFLSGSSTANQVLTGSNYHNVFFVDLAAKSGVDRVANFQHTDLLALTGPLAGASAANLVSLALGKVVLDGSDVIQLDGIQSLRSLGTTSHGLALYADGSTRPAGAIEGTLANSTLLGDVGDKTSQTFFFDTALDLNLGDHKITNFGARDIVVTTSALPDSNGDGIIGFGHDKTADLVGGTGAPTDKPTPGEAGTLALYSGTGTMLPSLEFDGTVVHGGVTYYVYSQIDSAAGTTTLHF